MGVESFRLFADGERGDVDVDFLVLISKVVLVPAVQGSLRAIARVVCDRVAVVSSNKYI